VSNQEIIAKLRSQGILTSIGTDSPITEEEANLFTAACLSSERRFMEQDAGMLLLATTVNVSGQKLSFEDSKRRTGLLYEMAVQGVIDSKVFVIAGKILTSQMSEEAMQKLHKASAKVETSRSRAANKTNPAKKSWQFWK
jgi:hypothetical protein